MTDEDIKKEVAEIFGLARQVEEAENKLMQLEPFIEFNKLQKEYQERSAKVWKQIETQMIDNDIKSIKGDWGSITIAERLNWDVNIDELPTKFIKKVPDTTKLSASYKLEGKAPKGATPSYSKYLTKRLK